MPEEIILAAGLKPVRLLGTLEPVRLACQLVPSNLCPYVRSLIDQASSAQLDGIVIASSCNAAGHLADAWLRQFPYTFCHVVQVPRVTGAGALPYYEEQLWLLIRAIEESFDVEITSCALKDAIAAVSRIKRLLRRACDLLKGPEKGPEPGITGGQYLRMVELAMTADKVEAERQLMDTMSGLAGPGGLAVGDSHGPAAAHAVHGSSRPPAPSPGRPLAPSPGRPRVFVVGSLCPISVVDMIEESGGAVVGEDLCAGSRYFLVNDALTSDALANGSLASGGLVSGRLANGGLADGGPANGGLADDAVGPEASRLDGLIRYLAARYLAKEPCARMQDSGERYSRLVERISALNVDGVILHILKFCDIYLYEYPILRARLDELGIPVLLLEGDYTTGGVGQAQTRIGAFVEMLDRRPI